MYYLHLYNVVSALKTKHKMLFIRSLLQSTKFKCNTYYVNKQEIKMLSYLEPSNLM